MKFKLLAIICLLTGIFFSCKTYRYFDLQVLKPAESEVIKADRFFIISPNHILFDSIHKKNSDYYNNLLTSLGLELKNKLSESPLYQNTEIINCSKSAFINSYYNQMDYLQRNNTIICTLNSIMFKDTVYPAYIDWTWKYEYELIYYLKISFCRASSIDDIFSLTVQDTVYWNSPAIYYYANRLDIDKKKLLNTIDLDKIISERVAFKIAPFWVASERMLFYYANKPMKQAYLHYCNNELDKAISKWKYVYDRGAKNLSSMAAYNIAVTYETIDSIESAKQWLEKSVNIKPTPEALKYKKILQKRLLENEKINNQLLNL